MLKFFRMKRTLLIGLFLTLLAALVSGCGQKATPYVPQASIPRSEPTSTKLSPDLSLSKKPSLLKVRGMKNLLNTCYFNSLWQMLSHAKPVVDQIGQWASDNLLLRQIADLMQEHSEVGRETPIQPRSLFLSFNLIRPEFFRIGQQQDAMEAFELTMQIITQTATLAHVAPISDLFKFNVNEITVCENADFGNQKPLPYTSLSLGLPISKSAISLDSLIAAFFLPESLQGVARCHMQGATLVKVMASSPAVLLVSIKRGGLSPSNSMQKNHSPLAFTPEIDISEFAETKAKYKLIGIVHHAGPHMHAGHYYAEILHEGEWFRISDDYVESIPVASQPSRTAYLFLFEKQDS